MLYELESSGDRICWYGFDIEDDGGGLEIDELKNGKLAEFFFLEIWGF